MTDPSGRSDGFLVLHVRVRQARDGAFTVNPIVPRSGDDGSGVQLTGDDFRELAQLINRLDEALKEMVRHSASAPTRAEASLAQDAAIEWLAINLGPAQAAAFKAAAPDPFVPSTFPAEYAGLHQRMRGRLTHLTRLLERLDF